MAGAHRPAVRSALLAHPDGPRVALGADLSRAHALGMFVERTTQVLHEAGFGLVDASRAAGSFIWFVVGRTVEEQALPDLDDPAVHHVTGLFPTLGRAMAERRAAGDSQDDAFGFSVDIMITGLRTLRPRAPAPPDGAQDADRGPAPG